MFSKEFMTFLSRYGEEENTTKKQESKQEIRFKDNKCSKLAYVTIKIKK
jgi:hypothetical protein